MKRTHVLFVALLMLAASVRAELEPVLIYLEAGSSTNISYTVPAGKVLLVEHMQLVSPTNSLNPPFLRVSCGEPGNLAIMPIKWADENRWTLGFAELYVAFVTLERPLKFGSGCVLAANYSGLPQANQLTLMGTLADPVDLYAAIDSVIEDIARDHDDVAMLVNLRSARPALLTPEALSSDPPGWEPLSPAAVAGTPDPARKSVRVTPDAPFTLFRFKSRTR